MLLWRKKTDKGRMTLGKVQKEYPRMTYAWENSLMPFPPTAFP